jgi:hypothetical protein
VEGIDDEVAGLRRAAEGRRQLPGVFVHDTERRVLLPASHVMVNGLVVPACPPAAGVFADVHRGLAVHAQAHDRTACGGLVLVLEVGEDGIGFGDFFLGLGLEHRAQPVAVAVEDLGHRAGRRQHRCVKPLGAQLLQPKRSSWNLFSLA